MFGLRIRNSNANSTGKLPFFGTTASFFIEDSAQGSHTATLGGSAIAKTALDNSSAAHGDAITTTSVVDLGVTNTEVTFIQNYNFYATNVVTPIHTSSHYQTFETPYLHELVGGDRNMEQTNLVCSPDGKTWDQITRDTSYIGNVSVICCGDLDQTSEGTVNVLTDWRGGGYLDIRGLGNKDFAIAYDRMICLRDGHYSLYSMNYSSQEGYIRWTVNGINHVTTFNNTGFHPMPNRATVFLKRGDYLQLKGEFGIDGDAYNHVEILRVH